MSKRYAACAAATALTYIGLCCPITPLNLLREGVPLGGWLAAALLSGLWLLYRAALAAPVPRRAWLMRMLCALCALCVVLDKAFLASDDLSAVFGSVGAFLGALLMWCSLTLALCAALRVICDRVHHMLPSVAPAGASLLRQWLAIFALLLLLWSPHIVMQFPGHIETTAGQQILQCFGVEPLSADNPVFSTLLMKLLLKGSIRMGLGDTGAVFVVSLYQLALLASALAYSVCVVRELQAPRRIATALIWFYGLCPLFPLYGLFIVKDVPFAATTLWFTCLMLQMARERDAFFRRRGRAVLFGCSGLALCLMRNGAAAVFALSALAMLFALGAEGRKRLCAWSLAALALFAGFRFGAYPLLGVSTLSNRQAENRSAQCQIIARVVREHGVELTAEELAVIDAALPVEGMGERYQPEVSDSIKDTWRTGVTAQQKLALDALTLRLAVRYPATAAQALLRMGIPYLTPGDTGRFRSVFDCGFSNIDALYPVFKPGHLFSSQVFRSTLDYLQTEPLSQLLCTSGLYSWLLIGAAAFFAARRRWRLLACCLPSLLVLAGCLLSPVAGYVRYALPYMLCAPTLVMACLYERDPSEC